MRSLPSRFRRLDGALADLPLEEPMLLTELDGFLTGVLLSPDDIAVAEWMQPIWGTDDGGGVAAFEDPLDVQWFADAVVARRNEIARDLARGKPQPILDVDRHGDVLWEEWIDGFAAAMALRPDAWAALAGGDAADAMARLSTLIAVADGESDLDSVAVNALQDRAADEIGDCAVLLYTARPRAMPASKQPPTPGRNDPCPCGSGRKFKRCCA